MAKTKIDFKTQIPAAAKTPLYAGVGAGDLAVTAVLEYVADVQKKFTSVQKDATAKVADVQKTVTGLDAKKLQATAVEQAKARRNAVESRVAELQAEAKVLPAKSQAAAKTYVDTVTGTVVTTYTDLAKRGEAVVNGTKLPSSATVEVKVNTTNPAARKNTRKPAVKKAAEKATTKAAETTATAKKTTAKKASAAKAPAKKTATTAKKAASTAKSTAKTTATKATPSSN